MAKGRKTGGRKAGVPNKQSGIRRHALATSAAILRARLDAEASAQTPGQPATQSPAVPDAEVNWHRGDAHSLLRLVYTDPRYPMDLRLDAAKSAIRFERPALVASHVQHSNSPSRAVLASLSTEKLKELLLSMDVDATPLIEVDRQPDEDGEG